ncbi:MAG: HPr family phosphocarrier protein [Clostridiales bacterium]|nr:HPr family phosphocarrier protein [Clostridiales bacterium]
MKKQIWANLNSIDTVKEFVTVASQMSCEIDVCSGRYVVDGKSILGLFSIDLSNPVEVVVQGTSEELETFDRLSAKFQVEKKG